MKLRLGLKSVKLAGSALKIKENHSYKIMKMKMKLNYLNDSILLFIEENSCLMNKSE
jgi:hypothetical protein